MRPWDSRQPIPAELVGRASKIVLLALDADGVLTEGSLILGPSLEHDLRLFNTQDGAGIKVAQQAGLSIAIVSGRRSEAVARRARELGIRADLVHQGVERKDEVLRQLRSDYGLKRENAAFMGDDLPDLVTLKEVGFFFSPSDAAIDVVDAADVVTAARGGRGCVRQAIEFILRASGRWTELVDGFRT